MSPLNAFKKGYFTDAEGNVTGTFKPCACVSERFGINKEDITLLADRHYRPDWLLLYNGAYHDILSADKSEHVNDYYIIHFKLNVQKTRQLRIDKLL